MLLKDRESTIDDSEFKSERDLEIQAKIKHLDSLVNKNSSLKWWSRVPNDKDFDFEGEINNIFQTPIPESQLQPIRDRRELIEELKQLDLECQRIKRDNEKLRETTSGHDEEKKVTTARVSELEFELESQNSHLENLKTELKQQI
jgi:chromosome segregation ATPase